MYIQDSFSACSLQVVAPTVCIGNKTQNTQTLPANLLPDPPEDYKPDPGKNYQSPDKEPHIKPERI